jgi:ribosomal protein S19
LYIGKEFIQQYHQYQQYKLKTLPAQDLDRKQGSDVYIQKTDEIIVYSRSTVIRQKMVGLKIQVYNGIRFFLTELNSEMVGHCVGEFAPTRKKPIPKKKKKKK